MIVEHYLQLLRYYRWLIVKIVATVGALAAVVSAALLAASPLYTAAASVAVTPTEAEYSFGRESGAGPRGTARALTSTYIEYLKSRPVIESAFDRMGAKGLEDEHAATASWPVRFVKGTMGELRKLYRILDSGRYVSLPPREAALAKFSDAINLVTVAESYILRVEVSLSDPKAAAAAANALAEAYVQRVTEQLENSVGEIGGFIREQIEARDAEVKALRASTERLNAGIGSSSLEEERDSIVRARELERQKLNDAQAQLDGAESELAILAKENLLLSGRSLTELNAARGAAEARRDAAKKNIQLRQETSRALSATLEALRQKEEPLLAVQHRLTVVTEELAQLHSRMLSTDLTRSSSLTQVRVIDPAVAPVYPASPRVMQNTLLGLVAGLFAALMLVVVLDTASGTVKTAADLRRIGGARSLGSIPHALLDPPFQLEPRARNRLLARLRALGFRMELGLSKLAAFEGGALGLTGFADGHHLSGAATVIAAALAAKGHKVSCRLADPSVPSRNLAVFAADSLHFLTSASDAPVPHSIVVESLPTISADWSLARAAEKFQTLVLAVPAGQIQEQDLVDFLDAANRVRTSGVLLVLLEAR
jgi:uncharacterized protein involved in exopolysaccharide biosynthesis